MPFNFELLFTGLCLFTFEGDPKDPDEVNVLLVKTPKNGANGTRLGPNGHGGTNGGANGHGAGDRHEPMLTYALSDLTVRSDQKHQVFTGTDGEPIARRELEKPDGVMVLELKPPRNATPKLTAVWRPAAAADAQVPRTPDEERWLDWSLRLSRLLPGLPPANGGSPFSGLAEAAVAARVRLTHGTLLATRVARGLNGDYVLWHFADENGVFDRQESQALAGSIVLRLDGLTAPVEIGGFTGLVEFAPPVRASSDLVRVSITNFPREPIEEKDRLDHVTAHYLDLVPKDAQRGMRFPTNSDHLDTPSSTLCPPGTRP